jgi:hypothetical protein
LVKSLCSTRVFRNWISLFWFNFWLALGTISLELVEFVIRTIALYSETTMLDSKLLVFESKFQNNFYNLNCVFFMSHLKIFDPYSKYSRKLEPSILCQGPPKINRNTNHTFSTNFQNIKSLIKQTFHNQDPKFLLKKHKFPFQILEFDQ